MIHVDRSRVPRPAVLSESQYSPASIERATAARFYRRRVSRRQRRFVFKVYQDKTVVDALAELFHRKCAYCETPIEHASAMEMEQFRPKGGVTERPEHPGYWWLASEWENLLISCIDCNRARMWEGVKAGKANRFPLEDETKRAFSPGAEKNEQPFLLDPCVDHPEDHLVFDENGTVTSDSARGQATIAILGLNRTTLVMARRAAAEQTRLLLRELAVLIRSTEGGWVSRDTQIGLEVLLVQGKALTDASAAFAGLNRQLIKSELKGSVAETAIAEMERGWDAAAPTITKSRREIAAQSFRAFQRAQSDFSLTEIEGRERFRLQRRQIERVSIRNFKSIKSLDLNLEADSGRTGWLMLLGENGTGKSSVLQAIALALSGAGYLSKLVTGRWASFRDFIRFGTRRASIAVKLSGFVGPHTLTLTAHRATYHQPTGDTARVELEDARPIVKAKKARSTETQSVLLGYGATRLLPRRRSARYGIEYARVENLFDPFLPLFDADHWLMQLKGPAFDAVAIVLKDLLTLDEHATLIRERGRVLVREHGKRVPIKQLSDGYQTVVAMSVDILEIAARLWPRLEDAEGIVLLDEIGAHLHPRWKMVIVESLRRAFPGMQFIASTHDPLCLRGLGEGEVVVMRRDESSDVEAVTGLPSPSDFRVDQLLTSEFFGLNSTTDPVTEELFDHYYALLAMSERTSEQDFTLEDLRGKLKDRRYLGITLREQLMYEAIDNLVALQKHGQRKAMPQLKREAVEEIARLWNASA